MDYHSPSLDSITFLGLTFEELFFLNYDLLSLKESKEIFGLRGQVKFLPRGPFSKSGFANTLSINIPHPPESQFILSMQQIYNMYKTLFHVLKQMVKLE